MLIICLQYTAVFHHAIQSCKIISMLRFINGRIPKIPTWSLSGSQETKAETQRTKSYTSKHLDSTINIRRSILKYVHVADSSVIDIRTICNFLHWKRICTSLLEFLSAQNRRLSTNRTLSVVQHISYSSSCFVFDSYDNNLVAFQAKVTTCLSCNWMLFLMKWCTLNIYGYFHSQFTERRWPFIKKIVRRNSFRSHVTSSPWRDSPPPPALADQATKRT